jgi:hypothetical protein
VKNCKKVEIGDNVARPRAHLESLRIGNSARLWLGPGFVKVYRRQAYKCLG